MKKTAQLTEQMRTMKQASVSGTKEAMAGHENLAVSIGKAAAKVTSLSAIVGVAYTDWARRIEEVGKRHDELAQKMSKGLGESGTLDKTPATKDWLQKMNAAGVTKDNALTALEQVSKAGDLSPERQKDLAGEAAKFGKTGADVGKLGRLAAEIDKASGGQMSPGDVMDTAMMARRTLGDKADNIGSDRWQKQLNQLRESGMSGKEVLDTAFTAMGRDEQGNSLELMNKKMRGERLSRDEKKDYARMFDAEAIKATGMTMERARSTDFAAQQLAATPAAMEGRNIVDVKKDVNESRYGAGISAVGNVQEARRQGLEGQGGFSAFVQRSMDVPYRGMDATMRFLGLETAEGQARSLARAGVKSGQLSEGESIGLLKELQSQTQMLSEQNGMLNRPQSRNVDAHIE